MQDGNQRKHIQECKNIEVYDTICFAQLHKLCHIGNLRNSRPKTRQHVNTHTKIGLGAFLQPFLVPPIFLTKRKLLYENEKK